jgi:hypothetical protein
LSSVFAAHPYLEGADGLALDVNGNMWVAANHRLCTSNSDGNRRDNFPSTAGEIGGAGQPRGKISCLDGRVSVRGMALPVR